MKIRNAEILCVGTEILIGDIVNTNAAYISKGLSSLGIDQYYQAAVGDNPKRLRECITAALERCDLLILSGGLGPTYDDITKEVAAECMGREMYLDEASLKNIENYFEEKCVRMPQSNIKQAYIPRGSVVLENRYGTAPGVIIVDEEKGKLVALLPGPPRELRPMFDTELMPYLRQFSEKQLLSRNVHLIGIGESEIESRIGELMRSCVNPTIAPYCGEGEVRLRVTASGSDIRECEELCEKGILLLRESPVGKYIYGIDTNLEAAAVGMLRRTGRKISFAESCTGGLVMKRLTDVPGASEVFEGGVVCYSERIKSESCFVDPNDIELYGVVSAEVAEAMARGIRRRTGADIGVGITGFAGPSGGDEHSPVGTVYISICDEEDCHIEKLYLPGRERSHIRNLAANTVFAALLSYFYETDTKEKL